jgi:hypothetical protein
MNGSANLFGEAVETYFSNFEAFATIGERMNVSHFIEHLRHMIDIVNTRSISETPNLLSRQAERALDGIVTHAKALRELLSILESDGIETSAKTLDLWTDEVIRHRQISVQTISRSVELAGVLDELRVQKLLVESLERTLPYCSHASFDLLKRSESRIEKLERQGESLRRMCHLELEPGDADNLNTWRLNMIERFEDEKREETLKLNYLEQSQTRGHNALMTVTAKEKAAKRQSIDNARRRIKDIDKKIKLLREQLSPQTVVRETSAPDRQVAFAVKKKAVGELTAMVRCFEALDSELPRQLRAFNETCGQHADSADKVACVLQSSSERYERGQSALLSRRATEFRNMKQHAAEVGAYFPNSAQLEFLLPQRDQWILIIAREKAAVYMKSTSSPLNRRSQVRYVHTICT